MSGYDWRKEGKPLFPPATDTDVQFVEQELSITLPQDLARFLKECNGAYFADSPVFYIDMPYTDGSVRRDPVKLREVFGAKAHAVRFTDESTIHLSQHAYGFEEQVPEKYVAIGIAWHPALLCISVTGDDAGQVYFWNPPLIGDYGDDDPPSTEDLYFVAKSFDEFLANLEPAKE
jgi:cell wall assembly regulator SMI1